MPDDKIATLKKLIRENALPYFTDEELEFYLAKNSGDLERTAYECLVIKAENTTLTISGMTTADTSKYFLRLASQFRPSNSGVLKG